MEKYVIKGNVPAKKNSKQITVRGGKPFVRCSDRYRLWNEDAVMQLRLQKPKYFERCVIEMIFYYSDKRKRDSDNGVNSVFDTLQDAGIIQDDNYQIIPMHIAKSFYDKKNPRVEIYIYEVKNEIENALYSTIFSKLKY